MLLKDYIDKQPRGTMSKFAKELGVSRQLFSVIVKGGEKKSPSMPPEKCLKVEELTNGAVTRYDLRNDAEQIWGVKSK